MAKITVELEDWIINDLNSLAQETGSSRSEVLEDILDYVLGDEELIDDIFPAEE